MSENNVLIQDINDNNTVSIDVDGLEWDNELPSILVLQNIHVHIVNAQFVLQVQDEHMLFWGLFFIFLYIQLMDLYQVGSQLVVSFVG